MPAVRAGVQMFRTTLPQGVILHLSGCIDETFDRAAFSELAQDLNVIVDFGGVTRVTSFGVREWVTAIAALQAPYICYVNVRPAVVAQFNMVAGFGGHGQLLTFYLPYLCGSCGKDTELLLDVRKDHAELRAIEPPAVACSCGAVAEFDDDAAFYFSYVSSMKPPRPPPEVAAILGEDAHRLRIDKTIEGSVTGIWLSGELQRSGSFKRLMEGLEGDVVLLLDGIQSAQPDGLAELKRLLAIEGPHIYLARVPLPVLESVATDAQMRGRAALLSVQLHLTCVAGHRQELELDAMYTMGLKQPQPLACPTCQGSVSLEPAQALQGVAFQMPSKQVATFLRAHLKGGGGGAYDSNTPQATPTVGPHVPDAGHLGRYEFVRRLGMGGMAEVYLARQHAVGGFEKQVVLKRVLPELSTEPAFRDMFLQEARLAARISHPNVVQIFDIGRLEGALYIAMEFVEGSDLSRLLRAAREKKTPFPPRMAAQIVADVCAGLHAAHTVTDSSGASTPIIHRDVSPHNVLISKDGLVKLTDFGIAKALDSRDQTPSASVRGKATYMPPEAVRPGSRSLDARADIFPVGIMLYELMTLEHPFRRASEYETLLAIVQEPFEDVRVLRPDVPEALAGICARSLERDVDRRYASARDMRLDLEAFLGSSGDSFSKAELARFCEPLMPVFAPGELDAQAPSDVTATAEPYDADGTPPRDPNGRVPI